MSTTDKNNRIIWFTRRDGDIHVQSPDKRLKDMYLPWYETVNASQIKVERISERRMAVTYNPEIYSVRDLTQAKGIILTPEGSSTEDRWREETPIVADLIAGHNQIGPDTLVLDYGCGIGRMAKELIARYSCRIVGVDISPSMRALSVEYVGSDKFLACAPFMLGTLLDGGIRFDFAISIWVLQHCLKPAEDIANLRQSLKLGGGLFVLNNISRAVPTLEQGWTNDGIDIEATLNNTFSREAGETLFYPSVATSLSGITFWAAFKKGGREA